MEKNVLILELLKNINLEIMMENNKQINQGELIPFANTFINYRILFLLVFFILFFSLSTLLFLYIGFQKQVIKEKESTKEEDKYISEETGLTKNTSDDEKEISEFQCRDSDQHKLEIRSFKIQKLGLNEDECEDQFSVSSSESSVIRVAVADGATESLFSDLWADIIVNTYSQKGEELFQLTGLQNAYNSFIQKANQKISNSPDTRQWFLYEKLEKGSHATFAGIEFSSSQTVKILTVGDSCVFWKNDKINKFSMSPDLSPEQFGSFPFSICHLPETWKKLEEKMIFAEIFLPETSQIILCTDALANWLSQELQKDSVVWSNLFDISNPTSFLEFINDKRNKKEMRNDDVTMVLVNVLSVNV